VSVEQGTLPDQTLDALRALGHEVRTGERQGDAHSIWFGPDGTAYGEPDKRTTDSKASIPQRLTASTAGR
jgi:gamma-glutamyltranspeptidase